MTLAIFFILVLIELLTVAWIDFRSEKISNKWILVNVIASLIFHLLVNQLFPLNWEILFFPLGFILIGFLLYLMNIMGAGDSKFLASLFLVIPLEYHSLFFEKLVLSTLVTGSILFSYKIYKNGNKLKAFILGQYWEGIKQTLKSRFSYAPVILLTWIIMGLDIWI